MIGKSLLLISSEAKSESVKLIEQNTNKTKKVFANEATGKNCLFVQSANNHIFYSVHHSKPLISVFDQLCEVELLKFSIPEALTCIQNSNDNSLILGGSSSGCLYLWESFSGRMVSCFKSHFKSITAIRFMLNDLFVVTAGYDSFLKITRVGDFYKSNTSPLQELAGHELPITGIEFSGTTFLALRIYSVSLDSTLKIWNVAEGKPIANISFVSGISCFALSKSALFAVVGLTDGSLYLTRFYDFEKNASVMQQNIKQLGLGFNELIYKSESPISVVRLVDDESKVILGDDSGSITIYSLQTSSVQKKFKFFDGRISNIIETGIAAKPKNDEKVHVKPLQKSIQDRSDLCYIEAR